MREITDSRRFQPITGQQLDIEPVHINQEILQSTTGLVNLGTILLNSLILMRLLLDLLDASPSHPFAMLIYSTSEPFMSAFQGLTRSHLFSDIAPEINILVAVIVYSLLGWIAIRLLRIMFASPR